MKDIAWTVHIELLSPLHIGSGRVLVEGIDWRAQGGSVCVVDLEALLEVAFERARRRMRQSEKEAARAIAQMRLEDMVRAGYLREEDFAPGSPLVRYRLQGKPATDRIAEHVKDVYGRPYLPGSSLKGALRTVLAVGAVGNRPLPLEELVQRRRRREEAARPLERRLFGPDPNRDLLRALRVSDGDPVGVEHLRLERVSVYPAARRQLSLDVEALAPGTRLRATLWIEGYLFGKVAEAQLQFGRRRAWLEALPRWGRAWAARRIEEEIAFFQGRPDGQEALAFYQGLAQVVQALGEMEFLLQVGWGGGWPSKTFGRLLQRDPRAFEAIVETYRMTRERGRQPGDPFPRTRRLAWRGASPALPLGWMRVRLEGR